MTDEAIREKVARIISEGFGDDLDSYQIADAALSVIPSFRDGVEAAARICEQDAAQSAADAKLWREERMPMAGDAAEQQSKAGTRLAQAIRSLSPDVQVLRHESHRMQKEGESHASA